MTMEEHQFAQKYKDWGIENFGPVISDFYNQLEQEEESVLPGTVSAGDEDDVVAESPGEVSDHSGDENTDANMPMIPQPKKCISTS